MDYFTQLQWPNMINISLCAFHYILVDNNFTIKGLTTLMNG